MGFFDFLSRKVPPPAPPPTKSRYDGWSNAYTGLGTFARDKVVQGSFDVVCQVPDYELQSLFYGDVTAAKVVATRPKEMFRRGYTLEADDKPAEDLVKYGQKLDLDCSVKDAMTWGRLYGGALLIVGADDGQADLTQPLNEKGIRSVRFLTVVDRRFANVAYYYSDPAAPKYGQPAIYQIVPISPGPGVTNAPPRLTYIHESRVIRFDGVSTDVPTRTMLRGWSYSVLQRPYDVLRAFGTSFQAVTNLLTDASQGVFKMQGLMEQIAAKELANLQTRMQMVDMQRSSGRSLMLDADAEDFTRVPTSFAGVADTIDRIMMLTASAADMPVTLLFGRSPAGMNATGDSDFRAFYDVVASEQKDELAPKLRRLYGILTQANDCPQKVDPDKLDVCFAPLWQPTDLEQAQLEQAVATKDAAYITQGVLLPEEVALMRFREGFSMQTQLSEEAIEAREAALETELDTSFDPARRQAEADAQDALKQAQVVGATQAAQGDQKPADGAPSEPAAE